MSDGTERTRREDLSARSRDVGARNSGLTREGPASTSATDGATTTRQRTLNSRIQGSQSVPSTVTYTDDGLTQITFQGYWWGSPVRVRLSDEPTTIRPMFGLSPPNGRATITCEYDEKGLCDVRASYTSTRNTVESTQVLEQVPLETTVATTYGKGRVGGREGKSRPLIFMSHFRPLHESEFSDRALILGEAEIYVEALGDWGSSVGSNEVNRYERDGRPTL